MEYIASLSYGKDSMAMLHVIKDVLDLPLDRIITADVWATDTIPADLPPMVEFKDYADEEIKKRWGIEVEHFCAMCSDGTKKTFEKGFYTIRTKKSKYEGFIYGWPLSFGHSWCNGDLKRGAFNIMRKTVANEIEYVGIASDEANRIKRHKDNKIMPLVDAEWTEQMCADWCRQNKLLAPTYENFTRGGCWFCINQSVSTLKQLRNNYPDLWTLLLTWDNDAPEFARFHANGHTLHDIERRFKWEDEGYRPMQKQFRWADVENPQMNIFQFVGEDTE